MLLAQFFLFSFLAICATTGYPIDTQNLENLSSEVHYMKIGLFIIFATVFFIALVAGIALIKFMRQKPPKNMKMKSKKKKIGKGSTKDIKFQKIGKDLPSDGYMKPVVIKEENIYEKAPRMKIIEGNLKVNANNGGAVGNKVVGNACYETVPEKDQEDPIYDEIPNEARPVNLFMKN